MWAAHDDLWGTDFIERNKDFLEKNCHCIGSISKVKTGLSDSPEESGYSPLTGTSFDERVFKFISNPGKNARFYGLYRRKILTNIHLSYFNFIGADWAIIVELLQYGDICLSTNEELFNKRDGISSDPVKIFDLLRTDTIELFFPVWKLSKYLIKKQITIQN